MTSPISLSQARQGRAALGQKSQANGLSRRYRVLPEADKDGFTAWFSTLVRRRCHGDAVTISRTFTVTEQTGRNWLAGTATPMGHHVDLANALWPEDFLARHAPELRRAA